MWQHWVNAVLGLWVVVVAFLGITGSMLMWTLVITGIVVAVLALWGASMESSQCESEMMMGKRA